MTFDQGGDDSQQPDIARLLVSLGDTHWRTRREAIAGLANVSSPAAIALLAEIVRDDHRDLSRLNAAMQVLTRTEGDVMPALLPMLTDVDPDTRAYVALTLGLRGDPRAIPDLIVAASDTDTNVRTHAMEALGRLHAAAAVDLLIQVVESREFELAFPALDALMAIGDERIAPRLIPLIQDPLLQTAAIEALGALGDEESVIALLSLLNNATATSGVVALAIQKIHDRQVARYGNGHAVCEIFRLAPPSNIAALRSLLPDLPLPEKLAVISIIGWNSGRDAESALLEMLKSPGLRAHCCEILVARGPTFVPELLDQFERVDRETQLCFVDLCSRVADRRAVPALMKCLGADDNETVTKVLEALSRICDSRVYESVKSFLGHPDAHVRHAAVSALNSLGHPDTARDMQLCLHDASPVLRESALKVAAYFGFSECVDSILAYCNGSDERIRRTAIEHLPCLDDHRIVPQLQQALSSDSAAIRSAAAGALGEIEPQWAMPLLQQALHDHDVWVRYFALRSQAQIPYGPGTDEMLRSMATGDPAMQVRIAAVEAMTAQSTSALIDISASTDDDLAIAALIPLGRTGQPEALPVLAQAVRSPHERRAIEAIRALGSTGLAGAVEPLRQIALSRNPVLAEESIAALGQLPGTESTAALLDAMEFPAKRLTCIAAQVRQGGAAIPYLARRLQDLSLDVRLAVTEVLIGLRIGESTELLESVLADPEPAVRHKVLSALAHIGHVGRQIHNAVGSEGDA